MPHGRHLRRVARPIVLACLLALLLGLSTVPAEARKRRGELHRGSSGQAVRNFETQLARIGLLVPSAVDRRYRAATVKAVKRFQRTHGLKATGRATRYTRKAVLVAYRRAIATPPAPVWRPPAWAAPGVTAHRGGASEAPENTMASIRHGVAVGADVVEFDLATTADGRFVLMHDLSLSRTTNCSGTVASKTLVQLAGCRTDRGNQPIPTFDEVAAYLATVPDVEMAPEFKDLGSNDLTDAELDSFVAIVQDNGLASRTYAQSFGPAVFARVRARDADIRLVYLSTKVVYVSTVRAAGADIASVSMAYLGRSNVLVYHANGVPIWTWTARSRTDLQRAWDLGVDSIGTDIPTQARALYR